MIGSCEILPVLDENQVVVPDAYVLYNPQLRERARVLERQHDQKYTHDCTAEMRYAVWLDGTMCGDGLDPIDPDFIVEYVEIERKQAKLVGCIAISANPLVVLYGPDSATHIAQGVREGLKEAGIQAALFAVDRNEPIPELAILLASSTGQMLYCDSVINNGEVSSKTLAQLPPATAGRSLEVMTYFTHATAAGMAAGGPLRDDRQCVKGLKILREAIISRGNRHVFYVADIGRVEADLFDRADAMAYAEPTHNGLYKCVRTFMKPRPHLAQQSERY